MSEKQLPIGVCRKCGRPSFDPGLLGQQCATHVAVRRDGMYRCRGTYQITLNAGDWTHCAACAGDGCAACFHTGWANTKTWWRSSAQPSQAGRWQPLDEAVPAK